MSERGTLVLAVVCATVLLSAGCVISILGIPPVALYPCIIPDPDTTSVENQTFSFLYGDRLETVTVSVPLAVYMGAKRADKNATLFGHIPRSEWISGYYQSFMDDPAQDAFMGMLVEQLRRIRAVRGLSDDEYAELMACFVQSVPYQTPLEHGPPKFPIETIAEGTGDCDDKSLLLAALLSHEGYNCSLFYFEPETHMAVGIADGDGPGYRATGYLFIESTQTSLVGSASKYLSGGVEVSSEPVVIRMGNGDRSFLAWSDVTAILDTLGRAERDMRLLAAEKADAEATMARLIASGRVQEYTIKVEEYRRIAAEYEDTLEIVDRIRHHLDDRAGLSRWLNGAVGAGQDPPRESKADSSASLKSRDQIGTWVTR